MKGVCLSNREGKVLLDEGEKSASKAWREPSACLRKEQRFSVAGIENAYCGEAMSLDKTG